MTSLYSFERSELRTLQNSCDGDNEKFLDLLADIFGILTANVECYRDRAHIAESKLTEIENENR